VQVADLYCRNNDFQSIIMKNKRFATHETTLHIAQIMEQSLPESEK
jgi:hypothetical protein